ncbi:MAG: DUF502 domain-containing protein [Methyloceanibacter sp.]
MALPKERIGISFTELLQATMAGGLLFLLPVALIAIVLKQAMQLVGKIVRPISNYLPVEAVIGVWGETVLAAVVLILVSLVAGLVARTNAGRRITRWFEDSLLGGLPQYQMVKSMAEGLAHVESAEGVDPALVSIEGGWQIGYLLEPLDNGWVTVFLPQAPTPMSGNVMYLPADRVRPLGITIGQAMALVKHIGVGSAEALGSTDLRLPAGA